MARLSPKKRRHIRRRANKETAREYAGGNAAARGAIHQANRQYGRDVRDARGAQRVETHQLGAILQNVRESGLKGKYAAQTVAELRARKADSIAGVPFAIETAQEARRDAVSDAQADLASNAADQQAAAGKRFTDLLDDARKNATDRAEDRRKNGGKGGMDTGVKNAYLQAKVLYDNAKPKERAALVKDPLGFAVGVAADAEGADSVDAQKAVRILFRRLEKQHAKTVKKSFAPWLGG